MGTHPIFESDFDCLTETLENGLSGSRAKTHNGAPVARQLARYQ